MTALKEKIEDKIIKHKAHFDLLALIRLLQEQRYTSIWFESSDSLTSEVSIIDRIVFIETRVIITLNIGLLSPQSTLPSYFFRVRDEIIENVDDFNTFLHYFDHILISDYIRNMYPQLNSVYFGDWNRYKNTFLSLSNLKSRRTVHYIFAALYPEYSVTSTGIEGTPLVEKDKTALGEIQLGSPYHLGDIYPDYCPGIRIILTQGEMGISLEETYNRLLHTILPLLANTAFYLEVKITGIMEPLHTGEEYSLGFRRLLIKGKKDDLLLFAGKTNRWKVSN